MARGISEQQPTPSPAPSRHQHQRPYIRTPLIESAALSKAAGCRIFLKLENLQPSGSFKSRGIGHLVWHSLRADGRPAHFYASSGGNAGLAAVTAARALGQRASVVVPLSTKPDMIAKIRAVGAEDVIQQGASWFEADRYLREELLPRDPEGVYVSPFDHPFIWEGNAGLVGEISEQMDAAPDAIVCSVGGGGLFSGICDGVDEYCGGSSKVVAVETIGCDSLYQSLKAGERITLPAITSQATSLGCLRVSEKTFECGQQSNVSSVTVTDAEAALGCWRFADDQRLVVEMSCGAAIVLAYNGRLRKLVPNFSPESRVVLVVCGGSNVSLKQLADWRAEFGTEAEASIAQNEEVPSTYTRPA